MGLELQRAFVEVDLPSPGAHLEAPAGAGPDWVGYQYLQAAGVPVEEIDAADWTRTVEVNVYGSFYCVKHALPALRRSPSAVVILLGSGAGISSGSSSVPYATSSGGVFGLSKALAPRLAEDGIRVNLLMPGNVDTPLKRRAEEAMNASGRARNQVLAEPAGVARVVRFPLSDEADYVRGEVFTRGRRRRESLGRSGESRGCPFGILSTGIVDLFVSADLLLIGSTVCSYHHPCPRVRRSANTPSSSTGSLRSELNRAAVTARPRLPA